MPSFAVLVWLVSLPLFPLSSPWRVTLALFLFLSWFLLRLEVILWLIHFLFVVALVCPSFLSIVEGGVLFLSSKVCFLRDIHLFWIGRIPRYQRVVPLCPFLSRLLGFTVLDWMRLDGTHTGFRLLHCLTYQGFRQLTSIPQGIVKISVPLSWFQRLIPRPTYGLAWLLGLLIGLVDIDMSYMIRDMLYYLMNVVILV